MLCTWIIYLCAALVLFTGLFVTLWWDIRWCVCLTSPREPHDGNRALDDLLYVEICWLWWMVGSDTFKRGLGCGRRGGSAGCGRQTAGVTLTDRCRTGPTPMDPYTPRAGPRRQGRDHPYPPTACLSDGQTRGLGRPSAKASKRKASP